MRPPCEQNLRYLIPQLRAHVTHHLSLAGWSQTQIAKELGITQAAVSGYRKQYKKSTSYTTSLFYETVDTILKRLKQGDQAADEIVSDICRLCLSQRVDGPLCQQHKRDVPALNQAHCQLCFDFPPPRAKKTISTRTKILQMLSSTFLQLQSHPKSIELLPEVRSNLVYSLPHAKNVNDIAGFPGRITKIHGKLTAPRYPEFGASTYTARLLLTVQQTKPHLRAAFCVRSRPEFIDYLQKSISSMITVSPSKSGIPEKDLQNALTKYLCNHKIAQIVGIHATGHVGLESIIYLFAVNPKILKIMCLKMLNSIS